MIAIGFRADAKALNWAVVEKRSDSFVLVDKGTLSAPEIFTESQSLAWIRKRVCQMIEDHRPVIGSIRYPEIVRQKYPLSANQRVRIEGVVLECLSAKGVFDFTANLKTIGSEMQSESAKADLGKEQLRGIDWAGIPLYRREAILIAVAGLDRATKQGGDLGN